MAEQYFTKLSNRSMLKIAGSEAQAFLQGILTCNVENIPDKDAGFGGLLSPQGKILFDFFVIRDGDAFLIDVEKSLEVELLKRLTFYRLRADVSLGVAEEGNGVFAVWGSELPVSDNAITVTDPRLDDLGGRFYSSSAPSKSTEKPETDYHSHRINIGMPQGGEDYAYGTTFPHEALYDQNNGVDFSKGCYVGQEVISRVHHRGTARKRIIQIAGETDLPQKGTQITAAGKSLGEICSVAGQIGLALLRLDRVRDANAAGAEIIAENVSLKPQIQSWTDINWPGE